MVPEISTESSEMTVVSFNREDAFQLFALFCGDAERTALALNVRPLDVLRVADEEGWSLKLQGLITLKKSTRPGDFERAMSAAINFVQAHRLRMFLDRTLNQLMGKSAKELEEIMLQETMITGKDGSVRVTTKLSTRPLADLAAALEKCHSLLYQALHDTASDRAKRHEEQDPAATAGEIHAQLAAAMSKVRESATPRAMLFDGQLEMAATIVAQAKPVSYPDDAHVEEG